MKVLIIKANQEIIKELHPKVEFKEETQNTCSFQIGPKAFCKLHSKAREKGYNPYSLLAW